MDNDWEDLGDEENEKRRQKEYSYAKWFWAIFIVSASIMLMIWFFSILG